jgi:hypothetical protein
MQTPDIQHWAVDRHSDMPTYAGLRLGEAARHAVAKRVLVILFHEDVKRRCLEVLKT